MRLLFALPLILLSTLLCGIVDVAADMFTDDRSSLVLTNSSYATITAVDGIPESENERTITMWVKLYQTETDQVMYSQNEVSSPYPCNSREFSIGYSASNRTFFITSCSYRQKTFGPANVSVEANKWVHVAVTFWSATGDGRGQVFVNGFGGESVDYLYPGLSTSFDRVVLGHRLIPTRDDAGINIISDTSAQMSGEIGQINFYKHIILTQEQIISDINTGIATSTEIITYGLVTQFGINNITRTYQRINPSNNTVITLHNGAYVHMNWNAAVPSPDPGTPTGNNTNTNTNTKEPATPPPAATTTSAPTKIPTDSDTGTIVVRSISFEVYWISRVSPPVDTSIARELYGVMRSLASQVNIAQTDVVIDLDDIYRVKGTKDSNKGYWHIEVSFKGLKQTATIEKALFTQKLFTLPNAANTKDDGKTPLSGLGMDQQAVVENLHYMSEQSCPDGTTIAASETCAGIRDSSATATHVSLMLIPFTIASSWILSLF